jgi:branched-subunit amino acid ABC-type transport system permease component
MLNIGLMQGFAGLSLFSVLLLMALGLAIIFGQMGVINMAHGEFMTIGAYTIYLLHHTVAPGAVCMPYYFPLAIGAAFVRLRGGLAGRVGADPPSLQAPARHAAGHLGPVLACSRCSAPPSAPRKSAPRCPTG